MVQVNDKEEPQVIGFASKALSPTEKRYTQTQREALVIVWAVEHYSYYLIGCYSILRTDAQGISFIFKRGHEKSKRVLSRAEACALPLNAYDFTFHGSSLIRHLDCMRESTFWEARDPYWNRSLGTRRPGWILHGRAAVLKWCVKANEKFLDRGMFRSIWIDLITLFESPSASGVSLNTLSTECFETCFCNSLKKRCWAISFCLSFPIHQSNLYARWDTAATIASVDVTRKFKWLSNLIINLSKTCSTIFSIRRCLITSIIINAGNCCPRKNSF